MKELYKSIDLPLEEQFKENWNWEDSYQRYELDQEIQDKEYFQNMDGDDFIHLIRKMDNFLMERGISCYFIKNYYLACIVFDEFNRGEN